MIAGVFFRNLAMATSGAFRVIATVVVSAMAWATSVAGIARIYFAAMTELQRAGMELSRSACLPSIAPIRSEGKFFPAILVREIGTIRCGATFLGRTFGVVAWRDFRVAVLHREPSPLLQVTLPTKAS